MITYLKVPILFLMIMIIAIAVRESHQISFERTQVDDYTPILRQIRRIYMMILGKPSQSSRSLKAASEKNKLQKQINISVPFPCPLNNSRSIKRPSNVNELRPGDIDVVAGMGDSLTAGFGLIATNLLSLLIESRGIAFSGGGQGSWRNFLTLPNILKEFNPNLYGYAVRDSFSVDFESRFNVAEGGAISENMPYMAKVLVNRIKQDPMVNLKKDWKMITFSIGANDFCLEMCYQNNPESIVDKHKEDLLMVLRTLRDNLPRTFVNIIPPPNLILISEFTHVPSHCMLTHSFECPCIFGLAYRKYQRWFDKIIRKWHKIEREIVNMDEFDIDDFTVVFQPFTEEYSVPKTKVGRTDFTVLSEDCFHLSQKGNAEAANSLWNNLLEPVGKKDLRGSRLFERFLCPTSEHPYLYTRRNSKQP